MAEEILVGETLTQEMIDAGWQLKPRLEKSDLKILAVFWLYYVEAEEWRLVLVSPRVDLEDPRKLYEELAAIIYDNSVAVYGLRLLNFTLLRPSDSLVMALAGANVIYDISGRRMNKVNVGGTYVGDIYVYFIDPAIRAYIPANFNYERSRNSPK